jgi:hypothetical protein
MKIPKKTKNILQLLAVTILFLVVDLTLANIVYRTYEPVVKGVLGIVIYYLVFITYIAPKRIEKVSNQMIYTYPTVIKYFLFGLLWSIITYWAFRQIIDMVLYLINLLSNK